jgi:hypothetical protein
MPLVPASEVHTIASQSEPGSIADQQAQSMMKGLNAVNRVVIQPGILRESRYTVYLFNVGTFAPMQPNQVRAHQVMRPPLVPCLMIPACPAGQEYISVASFPELVSQFRTDPMTEQPLVHHDEGAKVAQDIINPQNLTGNQWAEVTSPFHEGTDLGKFGIFYSMNEVPTAEELSKAKARIEKTYRAELQKAEVLARAGKMNEISELAHFAADYFRVKAGWHTPVEIPETCPNCGEDIKKGVAYHVNTFGAKCVIDWRKSYNAGAVKYEDIPEEFRWKKDKSSTGAAV